MSKINTGMMGSRTQPRPRIRVRILRGHPFYVAGTVLTPPAGARDILLRQRDPLGRPVAEIVNDDPVVAETPAPEMAAPVVVAEVVTDGPAAPNKSGSRRK